MVHAHPDGAHTEYDRKYAEEAEGPYGSVEIHRRHLGEKAGSRRDDTGRSRDSHVPAGRILNALEHIQRHDEQADGGARDTPGDAVDRQRNEEKRERENEREDSATEQEIEPLFHRTLLVPEDSGSAFIIPLWSMKVNTYHACYLTLSIRRGTLASLGCPGNRAFLFKTR